MTYRVVGSLRLNITTQPNKINRLAQIKRITSGMILLLVTAGAAFAQSSQEVRLIEFWDDREPLSVMQVDHSPWQSILDRYLDDQHPTGINRFSYSAVTNADRQMLNNYIDYLQALEPRQLNDQEQKAYWVNLYNAVIVGFIVNEDDTVGSIRAIRSGIFTPGPWQRESITISQQELSLEDVEHGILRPIWNDNRIHYVLNNASLGCPNLRKIAYTGQNIEAQLEAAAREFVNHPRAVTKVGGDLILSELYDWYRADFGNRISGVVQHLLQYAEPELNARLQQFDEVRYDYNWRLNRP